MKRIHLYLALCLAILFFASCKKLERNNPLDANGTSNNKTGTNNGTANSPDIKFSRYTVQSDDNKDGIINKGEDVQLNIFLKNTGSNTANGVRATITSTSSYISSLSPTSAVGYYYYGYSSYDYISQGGEGYNTSQTFNFKVSSTTPVGTAITFKVSITDASNNTWTDSFTITVAATGASIGFSKYTVQSDDNKDGIINKGEAIQLNIFLKNTGSSTANGVRATITSTSSYISSLSPTSAVGYYIYGYSAYDYISQGGEGSNSSQTLNFKVSSTTPVGTVITFKVSITDASNNTWTDSFSITVAATGASIGFSRYTVQSDNNNDGLINKGEAVQLNIFLKNTGSSTANGVRATITCSSSYISSLSPTSALGYYYYGYSAYDYISQGGEGSNSSQTLNFKVSSTTPVGSVITFRLSITDESNNTWSDTFTITVQ